MTAEQVLEIRRLATTGVPPKEIASLFGLVSRSVRRIVSRATWPHLPPVA